jgi:hypothetical protein
MVEIRSETIVARPNSSTATPLRVGAVILVAILGLVFATRWLQPGFERIKLESGYEVRRLPLPTSMIPVGTTASVFPYLSRATTDSALTSELTHEIIPALQTDAVAQGDTIALILARRPLVWFGPLFGLTRDTYLRFDRQAQGWVSVPYRVPGH